MQVTTIEQNKVLDFFRKLWKDRNPAFMFSLSKVNPIEVKELSTMISETDFEKVKDLISANKFDIAQAKKVYAFELSKLNQIKPKQWEDSFEDTTPSLVALRKYKGEDKAQSCLLLILNNFVQKFGKRRDISDAQLREVSVEIIESYYYLTISDIQFILNRALKNEKVFNLDYSTILSLFEKASEERFSVAFQQSKRNHNRITANERTFRGRPSIEVLRTENGSIEEQLETIKKIYPDG